MHHEDTLTDLEAAVNDVITLVDESDQSELSSRLQGLSLRYHCHGFRCQCYPVQRWLDDRSVQLCCMGPCAVQVVELQVCVCVCVCVKERERVRERECIIIYITYVCTYMYMCEEIVYITCCR